MDATLSQWLDEINAKREREIKAVEEHLAAAYRHHLDGNVIDRSRYLRYARELMQTLSVDADELEEERACYMAAFV